MKQLPPLPTNLSRHELRKTIIRMRLEVQRQQLVQESQQLLKPFRQAQALGQSVNQHLHGSTPLLAAAGAAGLALLLGRKRNWLRYLRLALALAPLALNLRRNAKSRSTSPPSS